MGTGKLVGGFCGVWVLLLLLTIGGIVYICTSGGFASSKDFVINGKTVTVQPYGLGNEQVMKNDSINYEVSMGNVVLSVIFSESVVVPVCLVGWHLYQPVSKKISPPRIQNDFNSR